MGKDRQFFSPDLIEDDKMHEAHREGENEREIGATGEMEFGRKPFCGVQNFIIHRLSFQICYNFVRDKPERRVNNVHKKF